MPPHTPANQQPDDCSSTGSRLSLSFWSLISSLVSIPENVFNQRLDPSNQQPNDSSSTAETSFAGSQYSLDSQDSTAPDHFENHGHESSNEDLAIDRSREITNGSVGSLWAIESPLSGLRSRIGSWVLSSVDQPASVSDSELPVAIPSDNVIVGPTEGTHFHSGIAANTHRVLLVAHRYAPKTFLNVAGPVIAISYILESLSLVLLRCMPLYYVTHAITDVFVLCYRVVALFKRFRKRRELFTMRLKAHVCFMMAGI